MNLIDRAISIFSPAAAVRRYAARVQLQQLAGIADRADRVDVRNRAYAGADRTDTRGRSWWDVRQSPQSILEEDLTDLRHRAREIVRTDAGGAVESRVNLVVSTGFTPQSRTPDDTYNKRAESRFRTWAKRVDAAGVQTLWQFSRLVEKTHATDGEAFIVASIVKGRIVLELVDADRVDTPPELATNKRVRMGVETDRDGLIVAYHIQRANPYDDVEIDSKFNRVDADRVFHLFDPMFPAQRRGLPWMTRALNRLKDAHDLDEAALIAAQIEACFAAFVSTDADPLAAAIGEATETKADGERIQTIKPGRVHYLSKNEEITFSDPARAGAAYAPLQDSNARRIAAALNYAHEMLNKDWSGTSFAGGRLVLNEMKTAARVWQKLLTEKFLSPCWSFVQQYTPRPDAADLRLYLSDPDTFTDHVWTPPAWGFAVNPGENVKADALAVKFNQKLQSDVLGENGYDFDEFIARRKTELARLKEITPDPIDNSNTGDA